MCADDRGQPLDVGAAAGAYVRDGHSGFDAEQTCARSGDRGWEAGDLLEAVSKGLSD